MKKALLAIFAAVLLPALAACGGGGGDSAAADPNCGLYEAVTMEMMGISLDVADVFEDGFSIELLDGGKAKFNYDGESYNLKWTLDGTVFHAEGGGAELDGTLAGGQMNLNDVMDSGLNIVLVNDSYSGAAPAETAADATAADVDYDWWTGQWYGWRVMYAAGGSYGDLVDNGYDVLARIDVSGDGGVLSVWDYDDSEDDALIKADISFGPGLTASGCITSEGGYAFDGELAHADWIVDPGASLVSAYEHMILVEGTYEDPDNSDDWYTYYVFLRPWGMEWEDLRDSADKSLPYTDMMPYHYDDWYKEQI